MRLFRRGERGLDARPARGRPRQSGSRARARPPQRRLDGRRRARTPARWLVPVEVLRQLAEVRVDGLRLALLKPETYMNLPAARLAPPRASSRRRSTRSLVVHDDVDLEPGGCRSGSGAGSPAADGCARSSRRSARPTSCGFGSANQSPPWRMIGGTFPKVSTLLINVGQSQSPSWAGNGGRGRGFHVSLNRGDQCGLLTADKGARAQPHIDMEAERWSQRCSCRVDAGVPPDG